jgi:alpha 1,2-mannosyltransferase
MKSPLRSPTNLLLCIVILLTSTALLVHFTARPHYADYIPDFISRPSDHDTVPLFAEGPRLPDEYKRYYPTLTLPAALLVHPELYSKLYDFLSRPALDWYAAKDLNEEKCPRDLSDRLVNPDQLNGDGDFWRNDVTPEVIRQKRVDLVDHLAGLVARGETVVWKTEKLEQEDLGINFERDEVAVGDGKIDDQDHDAKRNLGPERSGPPSKRGPVPTANSQGRGIVTTGGNADTTARLITLLRFLRHEYNVTLPIEIWTFPGELPSSSPSFGLTKDEGAWKNFQIKGLAIALSNFKELIYLDSDNIPLRDPTYLFDTPSYTATGSGKAVFWPDLSKDHVDNAVWRIMGVPCDLDDFTFESGQIVIDKVSLKSGDCVPKTS